MSSFSSHRESPPKSGMPFNALGTPLPFAHLPWHHVVLDGSSRASAINGVSIVYTEKEATLFVTSSIELPLLVYRTFPLPMAIVLAPNANAKIVEIFCPDESLKRASFTTNVELKDDSFCSFYRFFHNEAAVFYQSDFKVSKQSHLKLYDAGIHNGDVVLSTDAHLNGFKASLDYVGLDFLRDRTKRHHDLTIVHNAKESISNQMFRGVYTDFSEGTFLGKVNIMKDTNQSAAHQLYRAILLSEHAKAFVRPQLEIYHHDIKASHGATIGSLDENQLFYLRSRGMSEQQAFAMLIEALVTELLASMELTELSDYLRTSIVNQLVGGYTA